jgi:hypothetical protein
MSDALLLRYSGGLVDIGEMDAYEAAGNIIAFTDFMGVCASAVYGEKTHLKTSVQGLEHGSFVIQFGFDIAGFAATLLTGPVDFKSFISFFKEAIDLFRHLGGERPTNITKHGEKIEITNNRGTVHIYLTGMWKLFWKIG